MLCKEVSSLNYRSDQWYFCDEEEVEKVSGFK